MSVLLFLLSLAILSTSYLPLSFFYLLYFVIHLFLCILLYKMPRKLKVVDIITENNQETLDNDEVTETPIEEKPNENEPVETVNEIIQESPL